MEENIKSIVELIGGLVVPFLVAIIAARIPIKSMYRKEKLKDRISPIVSVLDNAVNDVQGRLKKYEYGCFFDIKKLKKYNRKSYFYFIVRVDSINMVTDCEIEFRDKEEFLLKKYQIGNLDHRQKLLFPIEKNLINTEINVIVKYKTSHREYLYYYTTIYVEKGKITGKRYELFLRKNWKKEEEVKQKKEEKKLEKTKMEGKSKKKKKQKIKKDKVIRENDFMITENYNSNEIYTRLIKDDISLNKTIIYDKEDNEKK